MSRVWLSLAFVTALLLAAGPAFAADTGLVVLKNGDRIRGEVKGLQMGKLELSTTSMGTVYVEWDKVLELTAPEYFEVELTTGSRHYGTLAPGPQGTLAVKLDTAVTNLALLSVVRIRPLKQSFLSRLDGSINVGASYTASSGIGQGSVSVDVGTRRPKFEWSGRFDTSVTVQPDEPEKTRTVGVFSYTHVLPDRWLLIGSGKAERNSDLGLALRASAAAGAGRYLVQTNRSLLGAAAGFSYNREIPTDGEQSDNAEAFFGANYSFFTYDTPKTSLTAAAQLYPSLSVRGRYRTDVDISLNREIVSDFTIGLTLYDTYDSKPPTEDAKKHDFGITLSVGWVF